MKRISNEELSVFLKVHQQLLEECFLRLEMYSSKMSKNLSLIFWFLTNLM